MRFRPEPEVEFENVSRVLVIKLRLIGDVLLSIPVFRALRENFPGVRTTALVYAGTETMVEDNPLVDEIVTVDPGIAAVPFANRIRREMALVRELRARGFDLAVSLTSGDRAAFVAFLTGARYRLAHDPGRSGFPGKRFLYTHLAQKRDVGHTVLRNLDVLAQFGISTRDTSVTLPVREGARDRVRELLRARGLREGEPYAHLHPTASKPFKCWDAGKWAEVAAWLAARGIRVVVTAAPIDWERGMAREVATRAGGGTIDLSGALTLKELAALAQGAVAFLGLDSAPMHIAASVGTPVVALFGAGVESWSPWGAGHRVIHKPVVPRAGHSREERVAGNMAAITRSDVLAVLEELFATR